MRCFAVLSTFILSSNAFLLMNRQALPNCAANCLATTSTGSCKPTDDTCLCNDSTFISTATACIQKSCTGSDLTTAESDAQQLCLAVGVTLTSASPSATAPAASSTAASGAAAAAATTTTPPKNGALSNDANNALIGALAFGLAAFAL